MGVRVMLRYVIEGLSAMIGLRHVIFKRVVHVVSQDGENGTEGRIL